MITRATMVGLLLLPAAMAWAADEPSDTDRLQGAWEIKSIKINGQDLPLELVREKLIRDLRLTFMFGNLVLEIGEGAEKVEAPYTLDTSADPKQIDLTLSEGKMRQGIYQFDGERLDLSFGPDDMLL